MTYLSQKEFDALPEYSCTVPTISSPESMWFKPGAYWKCNLNAFNDGSDKWIICCYVQCSPTEPDGGFHYDTLTDILKVREAA